MVGDSDIGRRKFLQKAATGATGAGIAGLSGCLTAAKGPLGGEMRKGGLEPYMKPMLKEPGLDQKVTIGDPATGKYPAKPGPDPATKMKDDKFVDVLMVAYGEDQTNNYHFLPHVAWIEPGTTVRWSHTAKGISERRTHTITAITPDLMAGYPRLIPGDAEGWDSGFRPGVKMGHPHERISQTGFEIGALTKTFEEPGVYLYLCQNHYGLSGMAGAIVVGKQWGENHGDGWGPAMTTPTSEIKSQIMEADPVNGKPIVMKLQKLRKFIERGKGP